MQCDFQLVLPATLHPPSRHFQNVLREQPSFPLSSLGKRRHREVKALTREALHDSSGDSGAPSIPLASLFLSVEMAASSH